MAPPAVGAPVGAGPDKLDAIAAQKNASHAVLDSAHHERYVVVVICRVFLFYICSRDSQNYVQSMLQS